MMVMMMTNHMKGTKRQPIRREESRDRGNKGFETRRFACGPQTNPSGITKSDEVCQTIDIN